MTTQPSPNFAYLAHHDARLVALGTQAEEHYASDPATCLAKLRLFAEVLAKRAAAKVGLLPYPGETQQTLDDRLFDKSVIGATQRSLFHPSRTIRSDARASPVADRRRRDEWRTLQEAKGRMKMARFTHLELGNWRNFKKVDVDLQGRVFVVGPNASGKSNLLDAFRILQELAVEGGGPTNALEGSNRGGIRAVRSLHAGGNSKVTVAIAADIDGRAWTYRLVLEADGTPQKPAPARVVEEHVTCDGEA